MCLAIQEMMEDSKIEGRMEGVVQTCRILNLSKEDTIQHIMENYEFTYDKAVDMVEEYWQQ